MADAFVGFFQVALEGEYTVAEKKSLGGACVAFENWNGAIRDFEAVAVPVKRGERVRKVCEHGEVFGILGKADWKPADFDFGITRNLCAQDIGDELCAEAHTDDGFVCVNGFADERLFGGEPWMFGFFVDVHGAAHDDKPVEGVEAGHRLAVLEAGGGDCEPAIVRPVANMGEILGVNVLEIMESVWGHWVILAYLRGAFPGRCGWGAA